MPALASFEQRYADARALGDARTRLWASYEHEKEVIGARRETADYTAEAKAQELDVVERRQVDGDRRLLRTEIVQLFTSWEIYLRDRFIEAISMNPEHLQRLFSLGHPPQCTDDTGTAFLAQIPRRNPFQSLELARDTYRQYLDINELVPGFANPGVRRASILRNVTVHRDGVPDDDNREYEQEFGSTHPVWIVAVERDEAGTRRLAGPHAPVMTILDTCAESLLYAAYHVDELAR